MNKKALALIIGGLVIIGLIIYFIFFYDFNKTKTPTTDQTSQNQAAQPVVTKNSPATPTGVPQTAVEKSHDAATQLAVYFAERYGSASSQADYSNLSELELFMTDALKQKTRAFVAAQRAKTKTAPAYQAIVTQAILANFVTFNDVDGTAAGTVKTKRQETAADGKVTSFSQDLAISLKKVGGEWKVDTADWK